MPCGVGRQREVLDAEFDGDLARGGVSFALVVLVTNFDELCCRGFQEALSEARCCTRNDEASRSVCDF